MTIWDLNRSALAAVSGSTATYYLKEDLKAAGWTVVSSGDGTGGNYSLGTDWITSPAVFVQNGSWIALRSPRAPNRQLLFGHKGGTADTSWYLAYSRSAGFTGGAAATYPTAPDVGTVLGTSTTYALAYDSNHSFSNIMVSETSDDFYCFQVKQGSGLAYGGFFLDTVTHTVAGDPDPVVVGCFYTGGDITTWATGLFGQTTSLRKMTWFNTKSTVAFRSIGLTAYISSGQYGGVPWRWDDGGIGPNPFDGLTEEFAALWIRNMWPGPPYGYKGYSTLFRAVGCHLSTGDRLDSVAEGAKSRIALGPNSVVTLPWDGSTVLCL